MVYFLILSYALNSYLLLYHVFSVYASPVPAAGEDISK